MTGICTSSALCLLGRLNAMERRLLTEKEKDQLREKLLDSMAETTKSEGRA